MLIPFKLPALRKDEMRFRLDSKLATSCCVGFQRPSTLGPRQEQSFNTGPFFAVRKKHEAQRGGFSRTGSPLRGRRPLRDPGARDAGQEYSSKNKNDGMYTRHALGL
jgi:hypothetical protein